MSNKYKKDINQHFDQKDINKMFEDKDKELQKQFKEDTSQDIINSDEPKMSLLPHQRSIEDIIIITRETFFKVLDMLTNRENPIPFISESPDRFFTIALVMIILGFTLLVLSSIIKS